MASCWVSEHMLLYFPAGLHWCTCSARGAEVLCTLARKQASGQVRPTSGRNQEVADHGLVGDSRGAVAGNNGDVDRACMRGRGQRWPRLPACLPACHLMEA